MVFGILKRKGMMILCTTSKSELERIIKPRCPHFDGNKFVPDEYHVPQEELIAWSETSLKAPLNQAGHNRYLELFQMIFPKKYEELMINA